MADGQEMLHGSDQGGGGDWAAGAAYIVRLMDVMVDAMKNPPDAGALRYNDQATNEMVALLQDQDAIADFEQQQRSLAKLLAARGLHLKIQDLGQAVTRALDRGADPNAVSGEALNNMLAFNIWTRAQVVAAMIERGWDYPLEAVIPFAGHLVLHSQSELEAIWLANRRARAARAVTVATAARARVRV